MSFGIPAFPCRIRVHDVSVVSYNRGHQATNTASPAGAYFAVHAVDRDHVVVVNRIARPGVGDVPRVLDAHELERANGRSVS